jgi:hypothetical protein
MGAFLWARLTRHSPQGEDATDSGAGPLRMRRRNQFRGLAGIRSGEFNPYSFVRW